MGNIFMVASDTLSRKIALVEFDLAENCSDQVSCSKCSKKQDCDSYKNFYYIVSAARKSLVSRTIHVMYDSEHKEELHVSMRKEDFDDLVKKANGV